VPLLDYRSVTRRRFGVALAGGALAGCANAAESGPRLLSRPEKQDGARQPGLHQLGLRAQRDAVLYVPESAAPDKPAPLLMFLHGATQSEQSGIRRFKGFADEMGFLLLSPASEGTTWDAIRDGYGPDVRTIDRALAAAFTARAVDPRRIGIFGFSDGASYALGLGLSNGDLFGSVAAFSPGFIPAGVKRNGNPRLFVSHGINDEILPIATCSRRLVPELTKSGYHVTYREFDGPHTVPPQITQEALRWFLT
jgi:predicted esterase